MLPIGRLSSAARALGQVRLNSTNQRLPIDIETFGRLAPWASETLSSDAFVSVLVRYHEHRPYAVQRALITQIANNDKASVRIEDASTPTLDLTSFETTSGLIFLFWLFNRRLPTLQQDCALPPPTSQTTPANETELKLDAVARMSHKRLQAETFTLGLIDAWRMGSSLHAPRFQNDILRMAAKRLQSTEVAALKSDEPHYSHSIKWARQAFDALSPSPLEALEGEKVKSKGRELREFAVDVAAKRVGRVDTNMVALLTHKQVYDVGMNSLPLTFSERENLGTNPQFASEVFGSLGGQLGTKGVGIMDFARAYMVEEDTK